MISGITFSIFFLPAGWIYDSIELLSGSFVYRIGSKEPLSENAEKNAMWKKPFAAIGKILIVAVFWSITVVATAQNEPIENGQPVEREVRKVTPREDLLPDSPHPLDPALQVARETVDLISRTVRDYTCQLVMRERIRGRLKNTEFVRLKVRREQRDGDRIIEPFSVYLYFDAPSQVKGREVLYVHNENNNEIIAKKGGTNNLKEVTLSMKPDSKWAMRGRHYPVTEIGMANIIQRLIEEGERTIHADRNRRECQVKFFDAAKIEGRLCRCIQVIFPIRREELKFHLVRIFLDAESKLPVRFAAYTWPKEAGGRPQLMEEYTFLNIKVNVGLSDHDFDRENPSYDFYESGKDPLVPSAPNPVARRD
jgi:hypothetical protein